MFKYLLLSLLLINNLVALERKEIILREGYDNDAFVTIPQDRVVKFAAYTVSFDGADESNADGVQDEDDKLGLPEWVAYQINRIDQPLKKAPKRPYKWLSNKELVKENIQPTDATYKRSGYDRGHMCMKQIAWRLGANADWNTHTTLNACPQLHKFNAGIWLALEKLTQKWADKYGKIWVICGPIINFPHKKYIGGTNSKRIPVPNSFYKIIIRKDSDGYKVISYIFPHENILKVNGKYQFDKYITTVDEIENATHLDFLTKLPDELEEKIESTKSSPEEISSHG
jgi:DNA/RNA endonuclease G (NUC1)